MRQMEVFYAHTISPILIAVIISMIMTVFIGMRDIGAGCIARAGYVVVGAVLPLALGKRGSDKGLAFREAFGDLNSFVLDSLRGLDETLQYGQGEKRKKEMTERSMELGSMQKELNRLEMTQRSLTNLMILLFSFGMLFYMVFRYSSGQADFTQVLIAVIAMMGSFGPVTALASLSNNLNQTLASGERVLSLLEEEPVVEEVTDGVDVQFAGAEAEKVSFSYGEEPVLTDVSLQIPKGSIVGIHGESGCGKSTLMKLFMRFWDVQKGSISISKEQIARINTASLLSAEALVEQDTYLFHDSIAANIAIGKPDTTEDEIVKAAKKASLHAFISGLPDGYATNVGELGDSLSGGEKQRIGVARAFLQDGNFILMDEPTSNLDSLNEGMILQALEKSRGEKSILLVSHRQSTMSLADLVLEM